MFKCKICQTELELFKILDDDTSIFVAPCKKCRERIYEEGQKNGEDYERQSTLAEQRGQVMGR